ncbi:MAG: minor capsid protein, partial [Sporomusa sp.]
KELAELRWTVNEYIKYGKENGLNGAWIKQLENASARVHISRLEALKLQIQQYVERLYAKQSAGLEKVTREIYTEGYYRTAFEIQRGIGIGWNLQSLDETRVTAVLSKPWTADGRNFSTRIWGNKDQLFNTLQTELTQSFIRGDSRQKTIDAVTHRMGVSRSNAGRLVMTESAFFASASRYDNFRDMGVEYYKIVATLDSHTSELCQSLDGDVLRLSDWQIGSTAPPFHPNCRTTTVPYFEDNFGERAARDIDGKTYYVPNDMTYKEWYSKHVFDDAKYAESLTGITAAQGTTIKGAVSHLFERASERTVSVESIKDALINPLYVGKIVIKDNGKPSQRFIGEFATVNINPDTGYIITTWKTGNKAIKKYKKGGS